MESVLFDFIILFMTTFITYMMSTNFKQAHNSLTEVNQTLRQQQDQLQAYIEELRIAQDIQERSHHRMQLQSQLLDSVTAAIVATDMDDRIIYWGRGAEQIYGYTNEEVGSLGFSALMEQSDDITTEIQTSLNRVGQWHGEELLTRGDGSQIWLDSTVSMAFDATGEPLAVVGCSLDISTRKQAEHELRMALELEQERNNIRKRVTVCADYPLDNSSWWGSGP